MITVNIAGFGLCLGFFLAGLVLGVGVILLQGTYRNVKAIADRRGGCRGYDE